MSVNYNPSLHRNGLVHFLESKIANGANPQAVQNYVGGGSIWRANNFTVGTTANFPTFESNAQSDGNGTSYLTVSRDSRLETGSITFQIWFNLKNIPLNVGSNNNWRSILPSQSDPLRIVLEQSYVLNFSTVHTDGISRRYLNNNFSPITVDADGWQFVTYTYDRVSGIASCYKNDTLILSGSMTTNTSSGSPTTAGRALRYNYYSSNGWRIYGGTTVGVANPSGDGVAPGEVGNILAYNQALTEDQVKQNYYALRGRYEL